LDWRSAPTAPSLPEVVRIGFAVLGIQPSVRHMLEPLLFPTASFPSAQPPSDRLLLCRATDHDDGLGGVSKDVRAAHANGQDPIQRPDHILRWMRGARSVQGCCAGLWRRLHRDFQDCWVAGGGAFAREVGQDGPSPKQVSFCGSVFCCNESRRVQQRPIWWERGGSCLFITDGGTNGR